MGCPSRFRIRAAPCGGRGMASAGALSGLCTRADRPPSPRARSASSRAASPCRGRPAPAPMRAVRVQGGREVSRVTGRTIAGSLAGAGSLLGIALLCVEVCTPGALGCATHQCDTSFACVYPAGVQHGACAGDAGSLTLDDEPVYQMATSSCGGRRHSTGTGSISAAPKRSRSSILRRSTSARRPGPQRASHRRLRVDLVGPDRRLGFAPRRARSSETSRWGWDSPSSTRAWIRMP